MKITFDPTKRDLTLTHRGLDMARSGEVFNGAHKTVEDDRKSYGETRYITVGFLDKRLVVLVWTQRDSTYRIISLRKANDREQAIYKPQLD